MRTVGIILSVAGATALHAWLLVHCWGWPQVVLPGQVLSAYRGQVIAAGRHLDQTATMDPMVDAGAVTGSEPSSQGNLAALTQVNPSSYGHVLLFVCSAVPLAFLGSALAASPSSGLRMAAPWIGLAAWWSPPGQDLVAGGLIELALLGPLAALFFGGFCGCHRESGVLEWLLLTAAALCGWKLMALPWLILSATAAVCWLLVAHRHAAVWHGLMALTTAVAVGPAIPSVIDLVGRPEMCLDLAALGNSIGWQLPPNSAHASQVCMHCGAALGALILLARHCLRSPGLRVERMDWLVYPALASLAAGSLGLFGPSGGERVATFVGLCLLAPPLAGLLTARNKLVAVAAVAVLGICLWPHRSEFRLPAPPTVTSEPAPDVKISPAARILWEAGDTRHPATIVPLKLGVPVLDGASKDSPWTFESGQLAGRPIRDWSDAELESLFDRWNVGWVRAIAPDSVERLGRFRSARALGGGWFVLARSAQYFLRGIGKVEHAGVDEIVLTDVTPELGEVIISFRWHPGWETVPSRVSIEPEMDAYDALPLIRLRMEMPVSRLILRRRTN